jgi:hypothetical protein
VSDDSPRHTDYHHDDPDDPIPQSAYLDVIPYIPLNNYNQSAQSREDNPFLGPGDRKFFGGKFMNNGRVSYLL